MINEYQTYTLHFDGSSKPNPGVMRSSYLIHDIEGKLINSSAIEGGNGTSNLAEYIGLYNGIVKAVQLGIKHIKIIGDSELIINQVKGIYKCNKKYPKLIYYRDQIQELLNNFWTYELSQISRKENKKADKLCTLRGK